MSDDPREAFRDLTCKGCGHTMMRRYGFIIIEGDRVKRFTHECHRPICNQYGKTQAIEPKGMEKATLKAT